MKGVYLGATMAVAGMLLGFAFATDADPSKEAQWWDLMTAFGTCAAVVVACFVSWWDRRVVAHREAVRELPRRLSALNIAVDAIDSLEGALVKCAAEGVLKRTYCESMRDYVIGVNSQLYDASGIKVYRALIVMARAMTAHATEMETRRLGEFGWVYDDSRRPRRRIVRREGLKAINEMRQYCQKVRLDAGRWKSEILEDYRQAGLDPNSSKVSEQEHGKLNLLQEEGA